MGFLIRLLISAIIVVIGAYIIPGVQVDSFGTAILVALVLGLLNATIKPLLTLLTLPINVLTLGLFMFVINVLMIYLTDYFIGGFTVTGFFPALFFSLLLSLLGGLSHRLVSERA